MAVTSITPPTGAATGGLEVEISGGGLGYLKESVQATIGGIGCVVKSVTMTTIVCVTPALSDGIYDVNVSLHYLILEIMYLTPFNMF